MGDPYLKSQFSFSSGFSNNDVCFLIDNSLLSLLLSTFALEAKSAAYQNPRNHIKVPWGAGAKNPGSRAGGGATVPTHLSQYLRQYNYTIRE
jgi:hypothetical protein